MRLLKEDASPYGDFSLLMGEMALLGLRSESEPVFKIPIANPSEILWTGLKLLTQPHANSVQSGLLRLDPLRLQFHALTDRPEHSTSPAVGIDPTCCSPKSTLLCGALIPSPSRTSGSL